MIDLIGSRAGGMLAGDRQQRQPLAFHKLVERRQQRSYIWPFANSVLVASLIGRDRAGEDRVGGFFAEPS